MTKLKPFLFFVQITFLFIPDLFSQQTYFGADDKFTSLIDTKYLKNGDLVLLENIRQCNLVRAKVLKPDGRIENIFTAGQLKYYAFNELTDNNWVLTVITDPSDDVPEPFTFHTITFIEGDYNLFSLNNGNTTPIPLEEINSSAVINNDELVLLGINKEVYFTDFTLSNVSSIIVDNNLQFMKSFAPSDPTLYFKYINDNQIYITDNNFQSAEAGPSADPTFQNFHFIGSNAIWHYDDEIWLYDIFDEFEYLEEETEIYRFRQHGQNLTYYTVKSDNTITFTKLYLGEDELVKKESFEITVSDIDNVPDMHWDGDFKGITTTNNFTPLPENYADYYRGRNYVLDYNLEDFDLTTQDLDISIDDIEYTVIKVDTVEIESDILLFYADITMDVTITNNTNEAVQDVQLYSSAFEGQNCSYNGLKVDEDVISIAPNSSAVVNARYESLEFDNLDYLNNPLCIYTMAANYKFDQNFDDNIYCLPLLEFTSTEDLEKEANFSLYPNPAINYIQINSETRRSTYSIYSTQGQLISTWKKETPSQKMDVSNLNQGTYIMIEEKTNKKVLFTKI